MAIIDWLQNATDIAQYIDYDDTATKNNPEGDYASIERWLDDNLENSSYDVGDLYYSIMQANSEWKEVTAQKKKYLNSNKTK